MLTVSDLFLSNQLQFQYGVYNIIDCGIRTGKTFWAANNLVQFTRDNQLHRVLFLTDTISLKDQIISSYNNCIDADIFWENYGNLTDEDYNKIGIMCYQSLGAKIMREDCEFLRNIDVICWDECDSIFDFATQAFVKARKTDFAKKECTNAEVLAVIQKYSSKKEYMPLIMLGFWEKLVLESRILCIGLSATPERAHAFYDSLVSAANVGKLQAGYRIAEDIYFTNLADHVRELQPLPGRGYWCYSPFIEPNQTIVALAQQRGFRAIELHSPNNTDKPMTPEQMRVYNTIVTTGMVPHEYDFVVVNRALERGITIVDNRFDNIIIDSYDRTDREQAARQAFPYQRHLKVMMSQIPSSYLNCWLSLDECRELAELLGVRETDTANHNNSRTMSWNKLREYLPKFGYEIETKQKRMPDGTLKRHYRITGEWHDVEIVDGNFLQLVDARLTESVPSSDPDPKSDS